MKVGQVIDRKYQLVKEIGRGGFAIVYKGWDLGLRRHVAIKVTTETLAEDPTFIRMFEDEAYNTAKLNHNNIVQIYDFRKTKDNIFYIIMEYVRGKNLQQVLKRTIQLKKEIPVEIAAYIINEILKALYYAHIQRDEYSGVPLNIVHRDVTPSNIMVFYDGRVKLTDFGIAKATIRKTEVTGTGILKGKISYMSPEQVEGKEIDARADIFASGLVLYEMLTLKKLFPVEKSELATLQRISQCSFSLEEELSPAKIDAAIIEILKKALSREMEQRYQTALEFSTNLEEYLHDKPCDQNRIKKFMELLFVNEIVEEEKARTQLLSLKEEEITKTLSRGAEVETVALETPSEIVKAREQALSTTRKRKKASPWEKARKKKIGLLVGFNLLLLFFLLGLLLFRPPSITVDSLPPGAEVFLNQERVGLAPVKLKKLSRGMNSLTLKKEGYFEISYKIKVDKKKNIFYSDFTGQERVVRKGEILSLPLVTFLRMETRPPGAEIFLDGKKLAEITPYQHKLTLGKHKLRFLLTGFAPREGELNLLNPSLSLPPGWQLKEMEKEGIRSYLLSVNFGKEILIKTVPPQCILSVGDKKKGLTPQKIYLPAGECWLKIEKKGFKSQQVKIAVNESTPPTLEYTLKKYATITAYHQDDPAVDLKARVYLGNKLLGVTPLKNYPLPYQKINLVFRKKNFKTVVGEYDLREIEQITAYLAPGKTQKVTSPSPGSTPPMEIKGRILKINPEFPDTIIIIDGEVKGKGAQVFKGLLSDEYSVFLKHSKYPRMLSATVRFNKINQLVTVTVKNGKIEVK
jgi:serine/threonine protein kinase